MRAAQCGDTPGEKICGCMWWPVWGLGWLPSVFPVPFPGLDWVPMGALLGRTRGGQPGPEKLTLTAPATGQRFKPCPVVLNAPMPHPPAWWHGLMLHNLPGCICSRLRGQEACTELSEIPQATARDGLSRGGSRASEPGARVVGLLRPRPPGSALEAGAGMASQLSGWLGVTHLHNREQTAAAQQGGWKGPGPPGACVAKFVCVYFGSSAQRGNKCA